MEWYSSTPFPKKHTPKKSFLGPKYVRECRLVWITFKIENASYNLQMQTILEDYLRSWDGRHRSWSCPKISIRELEIFFISRFFLILDRSHLFAQNSRFLVWRVLCANDTSKTDVALAIIYENATGIKDWVWWDGMDLSLGGSPGPQMQNHSQQLNRNFTNS